MRVLLSWLNEMAPFGDDHAELGDQMSDLGMAVESTTILGEGLDGIVVAEVLALRPHPDADRVQLVDVEVGDGKPLQIVCGAFNMSVGDRVPLATLGTVMPGGMKIERRKLRGELSNGMLCSPAELGLGDDDHSGILILPPESSPGVGLADALGIQRDVLWDLEINPNRPDALSVAGVARDLAARMGLPFQLPEPSLAGSGDIGGGVGGAASVEIVDADLCGRFLVRVVRGVKVGESPPAIAGRLRAMGMRPVNSVVDASNYVMLELGQPNHTFDLAKVPGGALRVRWARDGETIETLDGVERRLEATDGVVANESDEAISIAGVMGGASTEISSATTDVLLEVAWWQPMAIARSSKRLGLRSEASMRFERGADPEVVERAAARFCELLAAGGASVAAGAVEARGNLPAPTRVRVRTQRLNQLLGTALSSSDVRGLLEPIGFECDPEPPGAPDLSGGDAQLVTVPSFRPDTSTETDVAEEVARHHGYSRIAATLPTSSRIGSLTQRQQERREVRQVLVGAGIDEAMPMPFLAPADLARCGVAGEALVLSNPLAAEESVLRTSLRPGLLAGIAYNASHRSTGVRLFEIGKVFLDLDGAQPPLPVEREHLGVALAGSEAPGAVEVWWLLRQALGLHAVEMRQAAVAGLHPTRSAELLVGGSVVGAVGEVDPEVLSALGIDERVAWLEADLDSILSSPHGTAAYRQVSRYPSSDVDLAFEVEESTPAAGVEGAIRSAAGDLLVGLRLFDVFRGGSVPAGTRSLAFSLRFQAADRTLTDEELARIRQQVIEAVESSVPARLR